MCAINMKNEMNENERLLLGMHRAASPPRRCPAEARHAWHNFKKKKEKKTTLHTCAVKDGVAILSGLRSVSR